MPGQREALRLQTRFLLFTRDLEMKKLIIIFAFLLIPCKESWSAFSSGDRGTSAAQFLKLGAGARPAAMGDAFTATTLGSESVYWNPAGLNYESKGSVSMMHGFWFEDIAYDWISGAVRLSPVSVAGLGIQRLSYGDIKGTDISGVETGNFSPSDMAISFSYAHDLGMLMAGGTFKYISSRIDAKDTAMAVDAGVVKSWDNIKAGLAVKNAGTKMKFADEKEPLPLAIKFGGSMGLSEKLLACTDLTLQRDNAPTLGLGG